eukprot:scaffold316241_cov35-Tisochrysis_lutea.AAC.2
MAGAADASCAPSRQMTPMSAMHAATHTRTDCDSPATSRLSIGHTMTESESRKACSEAADVSKATACTM